MSNESAEAAPSTPNRPSCPAPPDTWRRARFFKDYDDHNDEPMSPIAQRNGISGRTGRRWMTERRQYGSPIAVHRMRKLKAKEQGHKLGPPFQIPQETLDKMCSAATNPVRWKPLIIVRTLQTNLKRRKNKAGMYWDQVYFTDEAHYNVTGYYQAPRVLREQGSRKNPENIAEEHDQVAEWALHIEDDPLNKLLSTPKPPGKPRKKKNESWEQYGKRLTD
ncbi:hypothetical protein K469DRAFT_691227 [Zopfia rhizophila CBS 207.26]|uniref:Uncharacterized protein n=1 Tax=Zopfia rhizophila CBS 207.26 TaxID=1314779 RepID=A0A6A6ERA6_9PEZI|nr:hypothetical protein K469DRAFT_691227 [Zopfia rhizophila CBS 207.26]